MYEQMNQNINDLEQGPHIPHRNVLSVIRYANKRNPRAHVAKLVTMCIIILVF